MDHRNRCFTYYRWWLSNDQNPLDPRVVSTSTPMVGNVVPGSTPSTNLRRMLVFPAPLGAEQVCGTVTLQFVVHTHIYNIIYSIYIYCIYIQIYTEIYTDIYSMYAYAYIYNYIYTCGGVLKWGTSNWKVFNGKSYQHGSKWMILRYPYFCIMTSQGSVATIHPWIHMRPI